MYYNFVRILKTLQTTPAMAARVTSRLWEIGDILNVLETRENSKWVDGQRIRRNWTISLKS
jgi:hypothetical protein